MVDEEWDTTINQRWWEVVIIRCLNQTITSQFTSIVHTYESRMKYSLSEKITWIL